MIFRCMYPHGHFVGLWNQDHMDHLVELRISFLGQDFLLSQTSCSWADGLIWNVILILSRESYLLCETISRGAEPPLVKGSHVGMPKIPSIMQQRGFPNRTMLPHRWRYLSMQFAKGDDKNYGRSGIIIIEKVIVIGGDEEQVTKLRSIWWCLLLSQMVRFWAYTLSLPIELLVNDHIRSEGHCKNGICIWISAKGIRQLFYIGKVCSWLYTNSKQWVLRPRRRLLEPRFFLETTVSFLLSQCYLFLSWRSWSWANDVTEDIALELRISL